MTKVHYIRQILDQYCFQALDQRICVKIDQSLSACLKSQMDENGSLLFIQLFAYSGLTPWAQVTGRNQPHISQVAYPHILNHA